MRRWGRAQAAGRRWVQRFWLSGLVLLALASLVVAAQSSAADFIGGAGLIVVGWTILAAIPAVRNHFLLSMFRPLSAELEAPIRKAAEASALRQLDGVPVSAGEQVVASATVIDAAGIHPDAHPLRIGEPVARDSARRLLQAARSAGSAGALSAVARLTYPEEAALLRAGQRAVAQIVEPMAEVRPILRRLPAKDGTKTAELRDFATWLSGAPVLIDAMDSRYRVFTDIRTWHRRWYRGRGEHADYDAAHVEHGECQATLAIGDHDARVVDVHGIWRGAHPEAGRLGVVLETGESCYSATESSTGPGLRCKHLTPTPFGLPPGEPGLAMLPYGVDLDGGTGGRPESGPIRMLTAYAVLRTADEQLVLARRSKAVRSGLGVVSATAGGVVEVRDLARGGDVTDDGALDVARAAARETLEEVGVAVEPENLRPLVVFLANSVGRSKQDDLEGQLVVTALLLARTRLTFEEVEAEAACGSDLALGSYEVERLEACPVDRPVSVATWCSDNASRIDQHALLACLYASAVLLGEDDTIAAFRGAFSDAPWWLRGTAERGWPRVTADPALLLSGPGASSTTPEHLEEINPTWRAAWEAAYVASEPAAELRSTPRGSSPRD